MIDPTVMLAVIGILVSVDLAGLGIAVVNSRQMATRSDVEAVHDRVDRTRDTAQQARQDARRARYCPEDD